MQKRNGYLLCGAQIVIRAATRNGVLVMKCEICRLINKLGIPQSAHDLWFCPDKQRKLAAPVENSLRSAVAA